MYNILKEVSEIVMHKHVREAILTKGGGRSITEIEEVPVDPIFPDGTRQFFVTSEHPFNDSICVHIDAVYVYRERCVVLRMQDMPVTRTYDIIRLLRP